MTSSLSCWATALIRHLGFRHLGCDSMAGRDATRRTRTPMPILLQSCAGWVIHRAHQELISEQFVRGQSDPELKKYLWVVIRTQKDRKLQTLIEVCADFVSLSHTANVHRPAEQVFALEEDDDREEEMFAVVDRQQWNTQRAEEPPLSPELQQMFTLVRRMGYEMRLIARRSDAPRQTLGPQTSPGRGYRAPFRPGRDYSKIKCFI